MNRDVTHGLIASEEEMRLARLHHIQEQGMPAYPARSQRSHTLAQAASLEMGSPATVTGRLVAKRVMGKLSFYHLRDASGVLQIALSAKELGDEKYSFFVNQFDTADFVQVRGELFQTHKGETTVLVKEYSLLAKALLPLPEKWHGLTNIETRYRQRYLDLLANETSLKIALLRSQLVRSVRGYFDSHGFHEVETPILQSLYGGANARPFTTHHHALDIDLYLRIAPELYLKRLIVGGFEKVYEIARCFRNEGIDHNHNPEFTQIEYYWAYADYTNSMELVEDLLPHIITSVGLPLTVSVGGQTVDFTPPYPRVTMRELIQQYAALDIEDYPDDPTMRVAAKKLQVPVENHYGRGKVIDEIYKHYARPHIINPIFVIDHPVELSPLAKRKAEDPRYVERFQLLCAGGNELCNAFSELNDPLDQEERFREQERLHAAGDEEGMRYDEDYITALKHGMPPATGLGLGIDRLVKLLTDADSLKEVILFPTLRPEEPTLSGPHKTSVA